MFSFVRLCCCLLVLLLSHVNDGFLFNLFVMCACWLVGCLLLVVVGSCGLFAWLTIVVCACCNVWFCGIV